MKVTIRCYTTGRYGRSCECEAVLIKPVFFKSGKLNKSASLSNGYCVISGCDTPYGFGTTRRTIV